VLRVVTLFGGVKIYKRKKEKTKKA